ncbi:Os06g0264432, partial [Oryza sativa Japonica Group]
VPELFGVDELAVERDGRVHVVVLVQRRGVVGVRRHPPLPDGGDDHLREPREGAPRRVEPPVERVAGDEGDDGDGHAEGGHTEAPAPADVVLHVHHRRDGDQLRRAVAEVVPVEEAPGARPLRRLRLVELVGAERHHARPVPAGAQRVQQQRRVQHRQLPRRRLVARARAAGAAARRRPEHRHRRRHRQEEHALPREHERSGQLSAPRRRAWCVRACVDVYTYDLVDEGGGGDGPEAADEGVGEEGADERGHGGDAAEVGEGGGGLGERHVQLPRQVHEHVRREPQHGQLLRHLVRCVRACVQKHAKSHANLKQKLTAFQTDRDFLLTEDEGHRSEPTLLPHLALLRLLLLRHGCLHRLHCW